MYAQSLSYLSAHTSDGISTVPYKTIVLARYLLRPTVGAGQIPRPTLDKRNQYVIVSCLFAFLNSRYYQSVALHVNLFSKLLYNS
ncbi:hypothetical protein BSAF29S_05637 [Bacillus safensis subsp. safensis]